MTVEIFFSDFQSIVNGAFRFFLFFNDWGPVFCGTVAQLSTIRTYTFLFCCACLGLDGNVNDPMGIPCMGTGIRLKVKHKSTSRTRTANDRQMELFAN